MPKFEKLLDVIIAHLDSVEAYQEAVQILSDFAENDHRAEQEYNRTIRESAKEYMVQLAQEQRFDDADQIMQVIEECLNIDCRVDFDAYMQRMEWHRPPEKRFWQPRRKFLYPLCEALQALYDDELDFLAFSLPVRTGKSTLGCFFVSFVMGNRPLESNIMTGYANNLTSSFYDELLQLITDNDTYCYDFIFPEAPLVHKDSEKKTLCLQKRRRFASLTCRSLQGAIEGAMEASSRGFLYCDDMVEGYEQTLSVDRMTKLYDVYSTQLRGRKKDGAKEIHIGTRWAPNDLIGEIEERNEGNPRYRFIAIPALDGEAYDEEVDLDKARSGHAEILSVNEDTHTAIVHHADGRSNFEYPFGVGYSTEFYEEVRDDLVENGNDHIWSAKYQGKPYYKDGKLFEPDELRYYTGLPEEEPDIVLAVCDTKTTGTDFCVQVVDYVFGDDHYIQSAICDDGKMTLIEPRLVDQLVAHKVNRARYESNVAGSKIAAEVEGRCHAQGLPLVMSTKYTTTNKETRILADEGWIKKRCLFRTESTCNAEYKRFLKQLCSYSTKGKNKHDDVPDAMSMLRRFVESTLKAQVVAFKRPW